jgi:chemotaxis protein methyltransferase CheR
MHALAETRPPDLTDETFARFCALIYKETGIFMRESKKVLVANRIRRRLAALHVASYEDYYTLLTGGGTAAEGERVRFIDAVSTNETFFFRGESHFEALRSVVLPELFARSQRLRLWSAGCSTGEEPYSLYMAAMDAAEGRWNGRIEITATDISTTVIARAREGLYEGRTLSLVPPATLARYFQREPGGQWRVAARVRNAVSFSVHNLLVDPAPGSGFDIIFCRNVMIYFDRETQLRLVDGQFAPAMARDGYLFIGHAESLIGKSRLFRYAHIQRSPIYRLVGRDGADA